ncbi:aspartate/glutamate racemase family protein [Streptomyces sp. NBC_00525]|uniref:aspartate/glutamate racemase family protein n=1 Tax=Streptomyces sp. NBC_00525 TaxID=2903660 RepID=UPI002E80BC93|nr:aspartate/glutamate racemase family protein [Streptomyces sp. NBC_00525]WUC97848.1 aspartate/glutamate racemase family protein [Streptomyces sp. NBC_00525]
MTLALLHTSPVHVPVFDALRDTDHPHIALRHAVREDLLAGAVAAGPEAVAACVAAVVAELAAEGAAAVLCTCSTIGAAAEAAGAACGVPVLRVDRPMAAAAVRAGRVTVLATLAATLAPTRALLAEEAEAAGLPGADVRTVLVEGAWERFAAGDHDGCLDLVAAAVDAVTEADVIVLAQGSMAAATGRTTTVLPVLSSPRPGLTAAVAMATATRGAR